MGRPWRQRGHSQKNFTVWLNSAAKRHSLSIDLLADPFRPDELFLLLDANLLAAHCQHGRVHDPPLGVGWRDDDRLVHDAQRVRPGLGERLRTIVDEQNPGVPGKSVVGIEVPNLYRETVSMKEVMRRSRLCRRCWHGCLR